MGLECNIESRGRWIRGVIGLVLMAAALIRVFTIAPSGWRRLLVVILTFGAIFSIFEAARGWCAFRAMGIKTPF